MSKLKDLTNMTFGRLKVLSRNESIKKSKPVWECICDCGNLTNVYSNNLMRGNTKSCGCLAKEVASEKLKTHGMTTHRLYPTWFKMISRCSNPLDTGWENYGARGISVSEAWTDVRIFISEMESTHVEGCTLERINVNGNYCKENCKWLLRALQSKNKRIYKTNKVGKSGVTIVKNKGLFYIKARVQSNFIRIQKTWSLNKYGEIKAIELATQWLKEKYLELDFGITHGIS